MFFVQYKKVTSFFAFVCVSLSVASFITALPVSLLIGKIVSPLTKSLPYEIFYEGQKVDIEIDGNTLIFRMPTSKNQWRFFLLFVEDFVCILKTTEGMQQNTVDYQMVPPGTLYRVFELHRNGDTWKVIERLLPPDGRMPQSTIVVRCPAEYLESLEGGNRFQLPTIILKQNLIALAGSLERLLEKANELLLASLDLLTMHVPMKETIRITGNRVLLVPTA